jgi:small subunit ribosomal protein S17
LYKKYVKRFTRLKAHDEQEEAKMGDVVQVYFTRPLSKTKRWRLDRIVKRSGD